MSIERRRAVYAITPDSEDDLWLLTAVTAAIAGGIGVLQYRNKAATPAVRLRQAQALGALCRQHGVPLIINDHLDLALAVDADGLHLGADDGDFAAARRALGPQRWLGASCYNQLHLAHQAITVGADYVAFGAVFGSATKPQAVHAGLELLRQASATLPVPVCAIGGIQATNAAQVWATGVQWLAVIQGLFAAPDITATARSLLPPA